MPKRRAALPRGIRWTIGGIAAVVLGLAIAWALFVPVADRLARHDVGSATGPLHETALDNARGRLLTLGAGLFAAGALAFTARNFILSRRTLDVTEQGQVTDRYTKAIEQLGSKELDVRIGGIYALERVARDSARDHPTVMEVLTAFIREHSHEQWPPSDHPASRGQERSTRPDVQAALTVVGRRDPDRDIQSIDLARARLVRANLTRANLTGANLTDADLTGANLTGANLTDADLFGANLTDADLFGTHLTDAKLFGANLTGAHLISANLISATLISANLDGATLTNTHLARANLISAHLTDADLTDADLAGADLAGAHLDGATLTNTHLTHANLTDADLTRANLTRANLTGADLTRANLTSANHTDANLTGVRWPEGRLVPEGWRLDPRSGRLEQAGTGSGPAEPD